MTVASGIHTGLVRVVVDLDAINATLNGYSAHQHRRPNIKLGNMGSHLRIERVSRILVSTHFSNNAFSDCMKARTLLINHQEIDTIYPWLRNYHQIDESCSSQLHDLTMNLTSMPCARALATFLRTFQTILRCQVFIVSSLATGLTLSSAILLFVCSV